jgi:hypothetical protein
MYICDKLYYTPKLFRSDKYIDKRNNLSRRYNNFKVMWTQFFKTNIARYKDTDKSVWIVGVDMKTPLYQSIDHPDKKINKENSE